MLLFEDSFDTEKNYLPKDGEVNFYGTIFEKNQADYYFKILFDSINWQNDEAIIRGLLSY